MPLSPHLHTLEAEAIHILREVFADFRSPVLLYSIGKDSSVVAPKSPDISHGAAWAAMNSRGERYPSARCG